MKKRTVMLGSVTRAIRAKSLLARSGIRVRLVKLDSTDGSEGCTHGVEIDEEDMYSVAEILRRANIGYKVK